MTGMAMTESQRLWEAWMDAYVQLISTLAAARVVCPSHGDGRVHVAFTGDPATRTGYATVWCDVCHEGIAVDRVGVPQGVPMLPFGMDRTERAAVIPPDVVLLPPDPWLEGAEEEEF